MTDILILWAYHCTSNTYDVIFMSETKKRSKSEPRPFRIQAIQRKFGHTACNQILSVHTVRECDTNSALYRRAIFKKITSRRPTRSLTDVMQCLDATKEQVVQASLQLIVLLYDGKTDDNLNNM